MKNFNVRYIISIPADQFENTTTKTSVLIFENVLPTENNEVIFYDLQVIKEPEDVYEMRTDRSYELKKMKGDIIIIPN